MENSKVDIIIAKVLKDLHKYDDAGLLDEHSMYSEIISEMRRFGNDVSERHDYFLEVKNGKAKLPDNFFSLQLAAECSPKGYSVKNCTSEAILSTAVYRERIERSSEWNECDSCCEDKKETVIKETVYLDMGAIEFYYQTPKLLTLSKNTVKALCHSGCKNLGFRGNPNEISLRDKTAFFNFEEGTVYIKYMGFPLDDDGNIDIPYSKNGHVDTYFEYYLKRTTAETLIANGDAQPGLSNLYQVYAQKESVALRNASNELKMSAISPKGLRRLAVRNRKEILQYEVTIPTWL